jgi:type VI protein secretion system component VasA
MDKLLQYYEQELGRLREAARFSADAGPDPEVERLLRSVALLSAATQHLIEDGHADFHSALLQTLQPHYLRPLPACGIVQISGPTNRAALHVPRGTSLRADGREFSTAYDVDITPVVIRRAGYRQTKDLPAALEVPAEAAWDLSITLETRSDGASFDRLTVPKLRVFINGSAAERTALLDALLLYRLCVCLEVDGAWEVLPGSVFGKVGFEQWESLLPPSAGEQLPRILSEYMHLPQKFGFIDIDIKAIAAACPAQSKRLTLHVLLPASRTLHQSNRHHFQLGCTPVVLPARPKQQHNDGIGACFLQEPTVVSRFDQIGEIYASTQSSSTSLEALRALLQLHGFLHPSALMALASQQTEAWINLRTGRAHMSGTDFSIGLDLERLQEVSLAILAELLEQILAAKTRENRFIRLRLVSEGTETIYRGRPQIGRRSVA